MSRFLSLVLLVGGCGHCSHCIADEPKINRDKPLLQQGADGAREYFKNVSNLDAKLGEPGAGQFVWYKSIAEGVLLIDADSRRSIRQLEDRAAKLEQASFEAIWKLADPPAPQIVTIAESGPIALGSSPTVVTLKPVGDPAKYSNVPHCNCGCEQTGKCQCRNCCQRTADPLWEGVADAPANAPKIVETPKPPTICTGTGCMVGVLVQSPVDPNYQRFMVGDVKKGVVNKEGWFYPAKGDGFESPFFVGPCGPGTTATACHRFIETMKRAVGRRLTYTKLIGKPV